MLASQVKQPDAEAEKNALSVSAALDAAKGSLEQLKLRVIGEVSEINVKKGYANAYFTLKDETGTLPCQMWLDRYSKTGVELQVGMLVEVFGRFSLYGKKGRMHFQVFGISLAGEGMLRQQVAMLERKLAAEGLMDPARKVPVPAYPLKIGVVTSPRGDAIHDVLRTTRRRFPLAHIYVAGVPVEGASAPQHMIEGMRACYRARVEVILLVRGGGSYEDLMPFNDEALARAIVKCPIPVATGIGHEPDTTIADLVGDLRASTPTGAAEAVTEQASEVLAQLDAKGQRMAQRTEQGIRHAALRLERYATRPVFKDPRSIFANDLMTLDMQHSRLSRALPVSLERTHMRLDALGERLSKTMPQTLARNRMALDSVRERLPKAMPQALERDRVRLSAYASRLAARPAYFASEASTLSLLGSRMRATASRFESESLKLDALNARMLEVSTKILDAPAHQVALRAGRLHDLSPLAILSRGYAVARSADGAIVKQAASVAKGDSIQVTVSDGVISATVDSVNIVERTE